jgi:hypothetical protein
MSFRLSLPYQGAVEKVALRSWQFAVSADMSRGLRQEIEALPQEAWRIWKEERRGMVREWAEVPYVPTRQYERRDSQPYRHLAIRVRHQQGELFEYRARARYYAELMGCLLSRNVTNL